MILQISKGNKKIYQEAESISLSKVDLSEMPKISKDDLLEVLNLEVNPENKMYFDMDGVMSDEERLNAEKAVKVAVLLATTVRAKLSFSELLSNSNIISDFSIIKLPSFPDI